MIPLWYPYTSYFFSKRSQKDTELNIPEVKDVDSKKDSKDSKESKPLTSDSKELTKRSQKETKLSIPEYEKTSEEVEEEKNDSKDSIGSKTSTIDSKELTYCEKLKAFFKMPFTVYVYDHVKHLKKILIFN